MLSHKKPDYYRGLREDIASLVSGSTERVLDVGCAAGVTGEMLKKKGIREVVGIEIEESSYKEALRRLDKVFLGDVQKMTLPFDDGYFDCIIYADVLEHLPDPWSVVRGHKRLLKDTGYVIASIPNVRHYRVVKKLLSGKWEYEERGVLDAGHLRFFTLESIKKMFHDSGYRIETLVYKISASKIRKFLNNISGGRLNEELSEQFLIKATKDKGISWSEDATS